MSDDILHQGPAGPAPETAEVVQPENVEQTAEGTGASEPAAETPEAKAEREGREAKVRRERAWRSQREAMKRMADRSDRLEQQNQQLIQQILSGRNGEQQQQPQQPSHDGPPKREQFENYEDYVDARAEYKAEQKTRAFFENLSQQAQAARQQQEAQSIDGGHFSRIQEYAQKNPEFSEVMENEDVIVNPIGSEIIKRMADSPAILHAIHREPAIAEHLNRMAPAEQSMYLGQLSAVLRLRPPQQISQAPAPGNPVGSKSSSPVTLETANYDEFVKLRRKQIAARRR